MNRGVVAVAWTTVFLSVVGCGSSNTATTSTAASTFLTTTTAQPSPKLSDGQIAAQARTFLLAQYGLGPDQQFRDIPLQGPGAGDFAAKIDHITFVLPRELDVFMNVTAADKDTALDAAHSIGLMIRQDPFLQQNVDTVRVGDRAGNELALQYLCPLNVDDNDCEPATWLH